MKKLLLLLVLVFTTNTLSYGTTNETSDIPWLIYTTCGIIIEAEAPENMNEDQMFDMVEAIDNFLCDSDGLPLLLEGFF